MPVNTALATQVWNRYTWLRDNGHLDYVKKAPRRSRAGGISCLRVSPAVAVTCLHNGEKYERSSA